MDEEISMNESIQAGAPDINYKQGDVMMGGGEDQQGKQVAASIWEQMEPEQKQQFGSFDAFFKVVSGNKLYNRCNKTIQELNHKHLT